MICGSRCQMTLNIDDQWKSCLGLKNSTTALTHDLEFLSSWSDILIMDCTLYQGVRGNYGFGFRAKPLECSLMCISRVPV